MRRKLAAGNWKMHGTSANLSELEALATAHPTSEVDILICPPAPLIWRAAQTTAGSAIAIGAQDCHPNTDGPHTGDIAAPMLTDAGASHVILGHSERRTDHGESNEVIRAKTDAALSHRLTPIVCIGEALADREAGATLSVLTAQLAGSLPDLTDPARLVIAYEPIWAIGTGLTPTPQEIAAAHAHIRAELTNRFGADPAQHIRLLYGGSVKPANASETFAVPEVDGALVGGASLSADDFSPIITALEAS